METFRKLERFRGTKEDVIKHLKKTFLCSYSPARIYTEFRNRGIITRDEYGMYVIHRCTTKDILSAEDALYRAAHKYYVKHKEA